jgi:hypothetical protein
LSLSVIADGFDLPDLAPAALMFKQFFYKSVRGYQQNIVQSPNGY